LVRVSVAPPKLSRPPPALPPMAVKLAPPRAWLLENVEEVTTALPAFSRPPPKTSLVAFACAWLAVKSVWSTANVAPASLRMPPPPWLPLPPAPPAPPRALFCLNVLLLTVAAEPGRIARPPPCPLPALPPAPPSPPTAAFADSVVLVRVRAELSTRPKRTLKPTEMPPPSPTPPPAPAAPLPPTAWLLLTSQLVTDMTP